MSVPRAAVPDAGDPRDRLPEVPRTKTRICVTSYNRGDYLVEALDSILAQTSRDLHILIVDDASQDGAADVARRYEREHAGRVAALCKSRRRGLNDSVNLALPYLRQSAFAAICADDDRWHPHKLERQIEAFAKDPSLGLVATDAAIIDAAGKPTGRLFSELGIPDLDDPAHQLFWGGNWLCAPSVLMRADALDLFEVRCPIDGSCSDFYMWLVIAASLRVGWLEEPLTYYRESPSSLTATRRLQIRREVHEIRRYTLDNFPAVRAAAGGRAAEYKLADSCLYQIGLHLANDDLREASWWLRRLLRWRDPRVWLRLAAVVARVTAQRLVSGATSFATKAR